MDRPKKRAASSRIPRLVLLVVALLLPTVSLIPLGGLWLWQSGYLIHWAVAACVLIVAVYLLQRRLLLPPAAAAGLVGEIEPVSDARWTPRQAEAWGAVNKLALAAGAERLASRDATLSLGLETIETVARHIHPERGDPLLQFTVPEALAVVERASANLRGFVVESFPLGDRVTVAQLMWLYRWRGAVQLVEKGYDLWRVMRLLNPLTAATHELREQFTRRLYEAGREHVARRLAQAYVKEVGRAAIDLYGGSLLVSDRQLGAHVSQTSRRDLAAAEAREAEPIRILVAGQVSAGKSTLVNALASAVQAAVDALPTTPRFTAYRLTHEGVPAALVIDSPGLAGQDDVPALVEAADDCDLVLWVVSAARAARDVDAAALAAIRAHFAATPNRHRPPMLLVVTHIDKLRPFGEWEPPYDLASPRAKAQSIRAAIEAVAADLGFAAGQAVPVRADIAAAPYNIDALWAKLIELTPAAQRARLLRTLADIKDAASWTAVWSQAVGAGRVIKDTFLTRRPAS